MKTIKLILLNTLCFLSLSAHAQKIKIRTGIEVLKEQKFKCLEGKRVGLITNPTGVDNNLKSTSTFCTKPPTCNLSPSSALNTVYAETYMR
jgi:uncharacterized protein YbbC (DUF1343 family)